MRASTSGTCHRRRKRLHVIGLAAAVVLASGCGQHAPALRANQARGANVLLVTIDTLRRDRVGAYGNPNHLTPTLDALASDGVRYTHAWSHAPMTLPAHTSILTGLTPRRHGVHNNVSFRLADSVPTLATVLKSAGYRTGAFVGAFVLDARFGLNRGFDVYDDRMPHDTNTTSFRFAQRRAADVVASGSQWIASTQHPGASTEHPAPFFAWVHLFDPHAPYDAPAEYRSGRSPYDAEVAYADAMLGRLIDNLRSAGLLDSTLVVVTADHGESLGEHGESTHGLFAYDATIAVPLIIRPPHGLAAAVVDAPAAHDDLLPTIADLVGAAAPADLDGRSLADRDGGESGGARTIYFEALDANLTRGWAPLTGVVQNGWKYIDLPIEELYDLASDPTETRNVARSQPDTMRALTALLAGLRSAPRAETPAVDTEAASRLQSLGYASGAAPHKSAYTDADDPKSLVRESEEFNSALEAFNDGHAQAAAARFSALLDRRADFLTARTSAATAWIALGRPQDAVRLLRAAPPAQQDSGELLAKLGTALQASGDLHGAADAFERAQQSGDANPDLFNDRGVVYAALGRQDDARRMFRALLAQDPDAAGTWYNLGILELSSRHPDAAADALRRAVADDPEYGEGWQALGAALLERNRAGAIAAWRRAEQLRPHDYDLLFNLGMVLADGPTRSDAVPYLQRFVREAPRDRYAADIPQVQARLKAIK